MNNLVCISKFLQFSQIKMNVEAAELNASLTNNTQLFQNVVSRTRSLSKNQRYFLDKKTGHCAMSTRNTSGTTEAKVYEIRKSVITYSEIIFSCAESKRLSSLS